MCFLTDAQGVANVAANDFEVNKMKSPEEVLAFWLDEVGPKGWYSGGEALDEKCRKEFLTSYQGAMRGACGLWLTFASGALAYIILMDQLPRNMFRESGQAFGSDQRALAAAKMSVSKGWDCKIDEPARQFFYMPLMHSENLSDQDRAVRLFMTRMPINGPMHLGHARAHREVIRRYGRFPTRNEALKRRSSGPEREYIAMGGYGTVLQELTTA